jgi:hypothetical protein
VISKPGFAAVLLIAVIAEGFDDDAEKVTMAVRR